MLTLRPILFVSLMFSYALNTLAYNHNQLVFYEEPGKAILVQYAVPIPDPDYPTPPGNRRYIVMLQDQTDTNRFIEEHHISCESQLKHVFSGFVACLSPDEVTSLRIDKRTASIEEDQIAANNLSQLVPHGLKAMSVEHFPIAKIDGSDERVDVDIAIMEGAGVQPDHPDLNVFKHVVIGGDYVIDEHATAVAGIAAALDNDFGTVGVAPGARIWSINLSGDADAIRKTEIIKGFEYVAEHADEIEIVNCSFGMDPSAGPFGSRTFKPTWVKAIQACVNKGVVLVCSAGNASADIAGPNGVMDDGDVGTDNFVPAGFPECMAVSAMLPVSGRFASYSNYSASNYTNRFVVSSGAAIDVAAPTSVSTTFPNSSYAIRFGGTSSAAPHVSGIVALYMSIHGRAYDADGVYRIRQAIVDASLPQSAWFDVNAKDPDNFPEGLASVSYRWISHLDYLRISNVFHNENGISMELPNLPGLKLKLLEKDSIIDDSLWRITRLVTYNNGEAKVPNRTSIRTRFFKLLAEPKPWPTVIMTANNLGTLGVKAKGDYLLNFTQIEGAIELNHIDSAVNLNQEAFNGFVRVPFNDDFSKSEEFSAEIWVKPLITTDEQDPFPRYSPRFFASREPGKGWSLNQHNSLSTTDNEGFSIVCRTGAGGDKYVVAGTTMDINPETWYHVVGVLSGKTVSLYINGKLIDESEIPEGRKYQSPVMSGITIGSDYGDRGFLGGLDEAAFYGYALNEEQILNHYLAGTTEIAETLYEETVLKDAPIGYWRLNDF